MLEFDDPDVEHKEEFDRVLKQFHRFVGDQGKELVSVKQIRFLNNITQEKQFLSLYLEYFNRLVQFKKRRMDSWDECANF